MIYCAKTIRHLLNTLRIINNFNDLYIAYCIKFYILLFETIEKAVNSQLGIFTKSDIIELCSEIGRASVENALKKLCDDGIIEKHGGGRSVFYSPKG